MDYREKYNNALDWMRSVYPTLTGTDKEDAEHYFPELAEGKDERIRKAISVAICGTTATSILEANGTNLSDALSYLEKQKDIWRERAQNITANMLEDGIEGIQRELIEFLSNTVNASWVDIIRSADAYAERIRNIVKKQKEQKPVECVTDAEMKKGWDELTKFKHFASALSDMYNIIPSHSSLRPKDIDWNNFCAGLLTYLKRVQPAE